MKITNQQQADAARKLLDANQELQHAMAQEASDHIDQIRAALAEWKREHEFDGVELTEMELLILRFGAKDLQGYEEYRKAIDGLRDKFLISGSGINPTDAGRRYLESRKKPELKIKWQVYNLTTCDHIGYFDDLPKANACKETYENTFGFKYEVREVKE